MRQSLIASIAILIITVLLLMQCSSDLKPCKYDTDCSKEKVCRNGLCVGLYENIDSGNLLDSYDTAFDSYEDDFEGGDVTEFFDADEQQDAGEEITDAEFCIPECKEDGKKECYKDGYTECVNVSSTGVCLKTVFTPCKNGLECRNGYCDNDECTKGEQMCISDMIYVVCEQDQNGFYKKVTKECAIGTICQKKMCCPMDMAEVEGFCIDKYEAIVSSSFDCSLKILGVSGDNYPSGFPDDVDIIDNPPSVEIYTCSKAGTMPSRFITYNQAKTVCLLSGKRLCTKDEFILACNGGHIEYNYPYGSVWQQYCNDYSSFYNARETGSMSKCVSEYGVYDLSGNVEEWVEENNGLYIAMGGKAGCRLNVGAKCSACSSSATHKFDDTDTLLGFRCCR